MIERQNQKNFSDEDWDDFITAVKTIKEINVPSPNYAVIASLHTPTFHRRTAHRYPSFLPWHREYLWFFESRLREENSNVTLPYWNWLEDRKIPPRLSKASEWDVSRGMDADDKVDNYRSEVDSAMDENTFRRFHSILNGPHGGIHMDVGGRSGEMGNIMRSPEDILFWLHHCFLDKLWSNWQKEHPRAEPNLPNRLLPDNVFTHTGNEVINTEDLGYLYI